MCHTARPRTCSTRQDTALGEAVGYSDVRHGIYGPGPLLEGDFMARGEKI